MPANGRRVAPPSATFWELTNLSCLRWSARQAGRQVGRQIGAARVRDDKETVAAVAAAAAAAAVEQEEEEEEQGERSERCQGP